MSAENQPEEPEAPASAPEEAPAAAESAQPQAAAASEPSESPEGALEAARAEAADWKNRALRALADLENTRRRFAREREDVRKYGVEGLVKDLLPVVDNLERALDASRDREDPLAKGVEMVLRQFLSKVQLFGAEPFDALGQPFDPQLHEAMSEVVTTAYEPGAVAQVFQRGWKLHDRLVRPAMVLIARAPEGAAPPEATQATEGDSEA
jgi:molecular chaperone GrpE